jgi:hypothetical protein
MVHLVNYRTDSPMKDIAVRVALPKGRTAKLVTLASPERAADMMLPFKQEPSAVTFTVPAVSVYEIAVVTFSEGEPFERKKVRRNAFERAKTYTAQAVTLGNF